jgi:hypothetical protein
MLNVFGFNIPSLWSDILILVAGAVIGWLGRMVLIEYRLRREQSLAEKERKIHEIYRPLYREFNNIAENGLPRNGWNYTTTWEEMEVDLKHETDKQIRIRLEEFVRKLHSLQSILEEIDSINNRIKKHAESVALTEELESQFPEKMVHKHRQIEFSFRDMDGERRGSMPLGTFLYKYGHILKDAESAEDLREKSLEHPRDVFEYWERDYSGWYKGLWQLKSHPRLEEAWPLIQEKQNKELIDKREQLINELESEAAEIRDMLLEKIG